MKTNHFVVIKEQSLGKKAQLQKEQLQGYQVTPRNTNKYGMTEVNSMTLINPSFIEKVLKKKITKKLDFYLKYIMNLMEEDDSDSEHLGRALNDLARYKSIVEYKYQKYLDEKYIHVLLKKIDMLEHEVRRKLQYQQYRAYQQYQQAQYLESLYEVKEEEKGKAR